MVQQVNRLMDGQPLECRKCMIPQQRWWRVSGEYSSPFFLWTSRTNEVRQCCSFVCCIVWIGGISLSGIIVLLFPNLHTVVGVFNGLLGDPFIVKLFDFAIGFRWCKLCVNVAGSSGCGAGWISCFHVKYICRGRARLVRTSNAAANIASVISIKICAKTRIRHSVSRLVPRKRYGNL